MQIHRIVESESPDFDPLAFFPETTPEDFKHTRTIVAVVDVSLAITRTVFENLFVFTRSSSSFPFAPFA
jgi:hypothetical protein